jgi:hypothetical protein
MYSNINKNYLVTVKIDKINSVCSVHQKMISYDSKNSSDKLFFIQNENHSVNRFSFPKF